MKTSKLTGYRWHSYQAWWHKLMYNNAGKGNLDGWTFPPISSRPWHEEQFFFHAKRLEETMPRKGRTV